jgi:hypothetical protein
MIANAVDASPKAAGCVCGWLRVTNIPETTGWARGLPAPITAPVRRRTGPGYSSPYTTKRSRHRAGLGFTGHRSQGPREKSRSVVAPSRPQRHCLLAVLPNVPIDLVFSQTAGLPCTVNQRNLLSHYS